MISVVFACLFILIRVITTCIVFLGGGAATQGNVRFTKVIYLYNDPNKNKLIILRIKFVPPKFM